MRVSLEVLREFMVFPGTLGRVSGVLERVRGDLTILLFLQPLLCDWHVLHGPKDVCVCAPGVGFAGRCRSGNKRARWGVLKEQQDPSRRGRRQGRFRHQISDTLEVLSRTRIASPIVLTRTFSWIVMRSPSGKSMSEIP